MSFEIFLVIYCVACVVINTAYEGTLKSHLISIKRPKPLETLAELATQTSGDIVFVNPEIHDFAKILQFSPIKALNNLQNERTVVARRTSYPELFYEALDGHIVVNSEMMLRFETKMKLSYADKSTDMYIVPQWFSYTLYVFHIPRMNRFFGLINHRLFQLAESGHFVELLNRVMDNEEPVPLDESIRDTIDEGYDVALKPIKLSSFLLLFIAVAVGNGLAFASCFLENMTFKKQNWTSGKSFYPIQ